MDGSGARRLGERLLGEVEVEGLSSLLSSLREIDEADKGHEYFQIPELDALLPKPPPKPRQDPGIGHGDQTPELSDLWEGGAPSSPVQPQFNPTKEKVSKEKDFNPAGGPVLQLISPPKTHHLSAAGKTSLIHLMVAVATLPSTLSSVPINGHGAAIVLLDPLSHFSVSRLAQVMTSYMVSKLQKARNDIDDALKEELKVIVKRALVHVHIFRPQSWDAIIATLKELPDYLFNPHRHKSMHRRIHSIIIEDVDAFVPSIRSSSSATPQPMKSSPLTSASERFTSQIIKLSSTLSCATILSSYSTTANPSLFRPAIPASWPTGVVVTRLAVRRVEVLKFAPGISAEEAEIERNQRWDVVKRGRFECWKIGTGVGLGANDKGGEGFVFRIGARGVDIEREDEQ